MSVFNEANSIGAVLDRVVSAPATYFQNEHIVPELIVVDNGSRDRSHELVEEFAQAHPEVALRLIQLETNIGKGGAIRMALAEARSDFCIIQDADFEYDPADYQRLLRPLLADDADVVLGSRVMYGAQRRPLGFWQAVANRVISGVAGMAVGLAFSDVETGFKAFRTSLAKSIPLLSNTFGLDPELVIQFAKRRARFVEVPISYRGRTYEEGKKIRPLDALDALWIIFRTSVFTEAHKDPAACILAAMSSAKRFNRWMADTLAPRLRGEVLELGAGIGNLTLLLSRGAHRYLATDTDDEHLRELRSRLEYRLDIDVGQFDFSVTSDVRRFQQSADTVVCLNVLEHVPDDTTAFENIRCCLRPGGTAVILVPQGPELFGSLDEVLRHKRRYTRQDLREKMSAAGFKSLEIIDFNRASRPGWFLNSRVLRRRRLSRVQLYVFDLLVPLLRRIDDKFPWPGNSLIAIGKVGD
jgi:2-polyprenyl-3-methyl-5-hydroxy-6-metoxy-1,4-benzoquinol methylase